MYRTFVLALCPLLISAAIVMAEDKGAGPANGPGVATGSTAPGAPPAAAGADEPSAKLVRGMAVLGNNEAPMSLFIVPWKSSELGVEADLHRTLNERDVPVDRDVFLREVEFYQVSVGSKPDAPAAGSRF